MISNKLLSGRNDLPTAPQFTPPHSKDQKKFRPDGNNSGDSATSTYARRNVPDNVTTQPSWSRQRRFNLAVATRPGNIGRLSHELKLKIKIGDAENITCRRQPERNLPNRTDGWPQDSSSTSRPLVARLRPSSSSFLTTPSGVDGNRASIRACWPIRLSIG